MMIYMALTMHLFYLSLHLNLFRLMVFTLFQKTFYKYYNMKPGFFFPEKKNDNTQNWSLTKSKPFGSNIKIKMNQIQLSWPKISTVIYPKSTVRINTGWTTISLPTGSMVTTFPHKSLLANNICSTPEVTDQTNQNQQIIQIVLNNNSFPVQIQYNVNQNGQQNFSLHRLSHSDLLSEQVLEFDFGNFLTGVVQVAAQVLPMIL